MKETQDFDYSKLSELLEAIPQLIEKIDKLENTRVQPNERTEIAGLDGEIETYLGMNPPQLSSAATTIRRTIEEYCIFEKGFDLNDVFLPEKVSRIDKFTAAGIEQDKLKLLDEMFEYGNQGTHNDNTEFMTEDEIEEFKARIRKYVRYLNAWGMSKIDKVNGRIKFCLSQDKRLKMKLDNGELDLNLEQSQKTLSYYFKRLKEFTTSYHVDLSNIDIRFKSKQDVYDYLLDKNLKKAAGSLTSNDRSRVCSVYKKRAEQGDFDACMWMCEYYLVEKNPQKAVEYYKLALRADNAIEKINRSTNDVRMRAGYALYQAGEYHDSLKWIDNIENDEATILAGDCYYSLNDHQEAIRRYIRIKADSLKGDKRKMLVANSLCETHPKTALQYYLLCSTAESDPEILKRIGDCYLKLVKLGYTEKALRAYEKALSITYSADLKKQIAAIVAKHITWQQVKNAFGTQWEQIVLKFANLFWEDEQKSLAIEWYKQCKLERLSDNIKKTIADYYFEAKDIDNATEWYKKYVNSARDYTFAKSKAHQLWNQGNHKQAVKLYDAFAVNDEKICKFLGEYYQKNNQLRDAATWYERYYDAQKTKDEGTIRLMIDLEDQLQNTYVALQWREKLANLLHEKGETESAIALYEEYIRAYEDHEEYIRASEYRKAALKLAGYYYFHNRYQEVPKMLSAAAEAEVLMYEGFALTADGRLFIAQDQRLVLVEKCMVDRIKIKNRFLSPYRSATLYLNYKADKNLSREIVLFEKLHKKDVIVRTLKENYPKPKKAKRVKPVKKAHTTVRKTHKKKISVNLETCMLIAAALFIFLATRVGIGEAGSFWKWTGFFSISFAILFGMHQAGCDDLKTIRGMICWITVAVEYLIKAVSDYRHDLTSKGLDFTVQGQASAVDASLVYLKSIIIEPIPAVLLIVIIAFILKKLDLTDIFRRKRFFKGGIACLRENPLRIFGVLAVGALGIFAIIYNSEVGYHWSGGMYYVQVVMIGLLTFIASLCVYYIKNDEFPLAGIVLTWIMLVAEYAIHLAFQAYLWLDPNDGPPCVGEFLAEGVLPAVIVIGICLSITIFGLKDQKRN